MTVSIATDPAPLDNPPTTPLLPPTRGDEAAAAMREEAKHKKSESKDKNSENDEKGKNKRRDEKEGRVNREMIR